MNGNRTNICQKSSRGTSTLAPPAHPSHKASWGTFRNGSQELPGSSGHELSKIAAVRVAPLYPARQCHTGSIYTVSLCTAGEYAQLERLVGSLPFCVILALSVSILSEIENHRNILNHLNTGVEPSSMSCIGLALTLWMLMAVSPSISVVKQCLVLIWIPFLPRGARRSSAVKWHSSIVYEFSGRDGNKT